MLAHGYRSCWVEPIADCGEGLFGITTLYYPEPRVPDAGDERILWTLASFIGFVISAAQREAAVHAAKERFWETPVRRYVEECLLGSTGPRGRRRSVPR